MSAQLSFDEITPADQLLSDVTFVVVDLETTGTDRTGDAITEIGAVKIRGGEVLGEFTTLVNPGRDIPPSIVAITGITNEMVADAPPLDSVLPAFLEFSRGAVLVAHNAPFDIGFLRANCERLGLPWPKPQVVDTVRLAKRVITKDETPNYRL
ncbi:3'-5' exoribonuclease, partial [Klebsiella pneumoniae]|nr:3'-5' exoribonuclease [Klebsiella pneumoniae]